MTRRPWYVPGQRGVSVYQADEREWGRAATGRWAAACLLAGLSSACAHRAVEVVPQSAVHAEASTDALEAALHERDQRISQLESRMALLESEAHQIRRNLRARTAAPLRETVVIGGAQPAAEDREEEPHLERERPMLTLHGRAERGRARSHEPLPPVPVVHERLPIAPLPSGELEAMSAPPGEPHDAYRAALDLVRRRDFDRALAALSTFLVRFQGDSHTSQVLFWRGEVLFALRDFSAALASFEGALRAQPTGRRAPDALLKVGLCHQQLGASGPARAALQQLKTRFPDSEAAKQLSREDAS